MWGSFSIFSKRILIPSQRSNYGSFPTRNVARQMNNSSKIRESLAKLWIPSIYAEKVRTLRTRSYELDIIEKENRPEILYTLLGFELKVGNKRFACPDLATTRYLLIFARLGCREVAVPYDITMISAIADQFETAWQRFLLTIEVDMLKASATSRRAVRSALVRSMREEISSIGAGAIMPDFKQSTKQR